MLLAERETSAYVPNQWNQMQHSRHHMQVTYVWLPYYPNIYGTTIWQGPLDVPSSTMGYR
jgi:hypothetical protein